MAERYICMMCGEAISRGEMAADIEVGKMVYHPGTNHLRNSKKWRFHKKCFENLVNLSKIEGLQTSDKSLQDVPNKNAEGDT